MNTSRYIIVVASLEPTGWTFKKDGNPIDTLAISHAAAVINFCMGTSGYSFGAPGASPAPWISMPILSADYNSLTVTLVNNSSLIPSNPGLLEIPITDTVNTVLCPIKISLSAPNDESQGVAEILPNQIHVDISLHPEHGCTFSGDATGDSIYIQSNAAELIFKLVEAPPGYKFALPIDSDPNSPKSPLRWGSNGFGNQPWNISPVLDPEACSFRLLVINNNNDNPQGNRYPFDLYFNLMSSGEKGSFGINNNLPPNSSLRTLNRGVDPTIINQQPDPTGGPGITAPPPQLSAPTSVAA